MEEITDNITSDSYGQADIIVNKEYDVHSQSRTRDMQGEEEVVVTNQDYNVENENHVEDNNGDFEMNNQQSYYENSEVLVENDGMYVEEINEQNNDDEGDKGASQETEEIEQMDYENTENDNQISGEYLQDTEGHVQVIEEDLQNVEGHSVIIDGGLQSTEYYNEVTVENSKSAENESQIIEEDSQNTEDGDQTAGEYLENIGNDTEITGENLQNTTNENAGVVEMSHKDSQNAENTARIMQNVEYDSNIHEKDLQNAEFDSEQIAGKDSPLTGNGTSVIVDGTTETDVDSNFTGLQKSEDKGLRSTRNKVKHLQSVIIDDWSGDPAEEEEIEEMREESKVETCQPEDVDDNNDNLEELEKEVYSIIQENAAKTREPVDESDVNGSVLEEEEEEDNDVDENGEHQSEGEKVSESVALDESQPHIFEKNPLRYSNLVISKQDIVEELLGSSEKRLDIPKPKDLFLSIELAKRFKPPGGKELAKTTKSLTKNEKIEKEVKEATKTIARSKVTTNNTDGSIVVKKESVESVADVVNKDGSIKKKNLRKVMDKETEKMLALKQLNDELPLRKRRMSRKRINNIPFLIGKSSVPSVVTEVKSTKPRRPCYLPPEPEPEPEPQPQPVTEEANNNGLNTTPKKLNKRKFDGVVKTYPIKRRSTETTNEIKSVLKTIANVTKELQKESEPKKIVEVKKTVTPKDTKIKGATADRSASNKKNKEVERLLGDEGAIRMIYDAEHTEQKGKRVAVKTNKLVKNDLQLKTKLVKNAVMRLSNAETAGVGLRTRKSLVKDGDMKPPTPDLSPAETSTPGVGDVIVSKTKKKQRAEASRILYRHSSSESFESADTYRRVSLDEDNLNKRNNELSERYDQFMNDETKKKLSGKLKHLIDNYDEDEDDVDHQQQQQQTARENEKTTAADKSTKQKSGKVPKVIKKPRQSTDSLSTTSSKNTTSPDLPVRKSTRPRTISKRYAIWASTSMDSLSVESLGLKKTKKSVSPQKTQEQQQQVTKSWKELDVQNHGDLVQIIFKSKTTKMVNAFNLQVLRELTDLIRMLSKDVNCKGICLTSDNDNVFCQGIDLTYIIETDDSNRRECAKLLAEHIKDLARSLCMFLKPVVVGVEGSAVGLGVTLLPYCDVVIASEEATFYTPYPVLGQCTEAAGTCMFQHLSHSLVSDMLFKCEKINSDDAFNLGLINQVKPRNNFVKEVLSVCNKLTSNYSQGMQSIKSLRMLNMIEKIEESLEAETQLLVKHWTSLDCVEKMKKFVNSGQVELLANTNVAST